MISFILPCFLPALISGLVTNREVTVWPDDAWETRGASSLGMREEPLERARNYALTGNGSGVIVRYGQVVLRWGDQEKLYDLKSTTKSIGVTALGLAIRDDRISLGDRVLDYHPSLGELSGEKGWIEEITIEQMATQTAGFEKPGGYTPLLFAPGTHWDYSDSGPNWLAETLTLIYREDMEEFLFRRVFTRLGIDRDDLRWRTNAYRPAEIEGIPRREFGSGIHANVDAMARIGLLYLQRGLWKNRYLLPPRFVDQVRQTPSSVKGLPVLYPDRYGEASSHYGLLWWNNEDGRLEGVPRDAFWSWGLYESLILVVPSLDLVVARAGESWPRTEEMGHYDVLAPFFRPIVESIENSSWKEMDGAPYPPSRELGGVSWASPDDISRQAAGSDNWPITWADDDHLYTAYGDGWGFEPLVPDKLSLGIARIEGNPPDHRGTNIRSESIEELGNDVRGRKASGILFLDNTLYLLARNAQNSQFATSSDYGESWEWNSWRFESSMGHPTILNFGQAYRAARDEYVYVYSHDNDSAYEAASRMILARVPRSRILEQSAFEYFSGIDEEGEPTWNGRLKERASAFYNPAECYRSQIHYLPGPNRYIWCQVLPGENLRDSGGFGIYDSSEPWGPWTTVFYTEEWDVGPGENCSIPAKWFDPETLRFYLVFSGADAFSVREGQFLRIQEP